MQQIPSASAVAVLSGDFIGFDPDDLFSYWTEPDKLTQWWPETATIDLKVGGEYVLTWPEMSWKLTGVITSLLPGRHLGFTWNWDHEPDKRTRQVDIFLESVEGGTRLAIFQGEFGDDELEAADRQGIIEGWIHFGMKLAGLRAGLDT